MIFKAALGDALPLAQQIDNYDPSKFLRAILRDKDNVDLPGSPIDLGPVGSLGMYTGGVTMPDTRFVTAQYVFYDDSGYTTISLNASGNSDIFILNGLLDTDVLPLYLQIFNYDASKYVQAVVRDQDNSEIAGSPFNLTPIGSLGFYGNNVVPVPATPTFVTAQYIVYEDSGYTVVSPSQGGSKESFFFVGEGDFSFGNLPWVGDTLCDWFQPMVFIKIVKEVVKFQLKETRNEIRFQGVIQPFSPQQLKVKSEGQRAWKWHTLHAETSLVLNTDEVVNYKRQNYRVMQKLDYSQYGYLQYDLVEDYRGI